MDTKRPESFSIVGAGRVGTAMAVALSEAGLVLLSVVSRSADSAERLANQFEGIPFSSLETCTSVSADLLVFTVSDDHLSEAAQAIAGLSETWGNRLVIHTSGTLPASALQSFEEKGASTASFHPVQTFSSVDVRAAQSGIFHQVPVGVEGSPKSIERACMLAELLGALPLVLSSESKPLFHAGAVFSSNYLVTIQALADELAGLALSEDGGQGAHYYHALATQALRNVKDLGANKALTGPVVRGDTSVVAEHLRSFRKHAPGIIPVYVALAKETIRLAVAGGRLNSDQEDALSELLQEGESM